MIVDFLQGHSSCGQNVRCGKSAKAVYGLNKEPLLEIDGKKYTKGTTRFEGSEAIKSCHV